MYNLDIDQNGTTDLTFTAAYSPDPVLTVGFDQISVPFGSPNAVVVDAATGDGFPTVSLLTTGQTVSPASIFSSSNDNGDLFFYDTIDPATGNFGGKTGFVGFRFSTPAGFFYGVAQVTVNSINATVDPLNLTIGTVIYNNTAGTPVTVPEPTMLSTGAAVGAIGLGRRRRSAAPVAR